MAYLVLARKHRPATFKEVIGQEHITGLLEKALTADRLAHAFLFCGPRGIGKTSCARILAKSLNCQDGPTLTPCGTCASCREIAGGNSFDVLEIDGASNRGIDEIRTLRENVKFAPSYGRFKIYIVDEVHMLTTEAFNALLKTLEEPPEHVKFIFATTDPNKVPATIISRCQRYDFKRLPLKLTVDSLAAIAEKEGFQVDQEALYAVAKASQGSFRDALSILDQVSAVSDRRIESADVYSMLGLVELDLLFALTNALAAGDCAAALKAFDEIIDRGKDIKQFSRDLVEHFRNLMIIKVGGKTLGRLVDYPVAVKQLYLDQSANFSLTDILDALDMFIKAQDMARITESLRTPLEIAFARLTLNGQPTASAAAGAPRSRAAAPQAPTVSVRSRPQAPAPQAQRDPSQGIVGNQKGAVPLSAADSVEETDDTMAEREDLPADDVSPPPEGAGLSAPSAPDTEEPGPAVDLERIRKTWDALTYGVSRERMSVATYLQEGVPVSFTGNKLVVGFAPEFEFHRESLASQDTRMMVEKIFSEKLRLPVRVEFVPMDGGQAAASGPDEDPMVQSALDTFQGKVVSKWHKD